MTFKATACSAFNSLSSSILGVALLLSFSSVVIANDSLVIQSITDFEASTSSNVNNIAIEDVDPDANVNNIVIEEDSAEAYIDEVAIEYPAVDEISVTDETTSSEVIYEEATYVEDDQNIIYEYIDDAPLQAIETNGTVPNFDPEYIELEHNQETIDSYTSLNPNQQPQANIWDRIRGGFTMPEMHSPIVHQYEQSYARQPQFFADIVNRSEKYLFHILAEIDRRGLPAELALLPIIESAYKPNAVSKSQAVGIWQIIPSTGRYFGLKQNWWIDDRRNITNATNVALNYLEKLYNQFGSWDLALAAYNAGEGTVGRAIKKNQALGKSTEYSALALPRETRRYVPKFQAVKNVVENPHLYGIDIRPISDQPYFTSVYAPQQIDQDLVAKLAEISHEEFKALNPNFKRPVITSSGDAHVLLLPIHAAGTFEYNLSVYDKPLVTWQPYTMQKGENLSTVARDFGISAKELSKVNQVPSYLKARRDITILVPNHNVRSLSDEIQPGVSNGEITYSLNDLAQKQESKNIKQFALMALQSNHVKFKKSSPKRKHLRKAKKYKVKRGDTLSGIAKRHRVSVKSIVALNRIKRNRIKIGQTLRLKR